MGSYSGLQVRLPAKAIQVANKAKWNERHAYPPDFYTVGYSGHTPEELLRLLQSAGVATVVDIRHTPVSQYRPGFSKDNLRCLLETHDIAYLHRPDLGVPRDVRALALETNDRGAIWAWYDENVVTRIIAKNLDFFFNAGDHPIALLCVERDPTSCHRHRLALWLEHLGLMARDL